MMLLPIPGLILSRSEVTFQLVGKKIVANWVIRMRRGEEQPVSRYLAELFVYA